MQNELSPRRSQAERTKLSKAKIIKEANRIFGENGFHGTRMSDIAREAGLTGPGLLHHFSCKEDLLIAVLENRDQTDQKRLEELFGNLDSNQTLQTLQTLVEYNQTAPEMVRLFTILVTESIAFDHPGHEFFVERYRNYRGLYIDLMRKYQDEGHIRKDIDVEHISMIMMAMMDGMQIQWLLDPDQVDMAATFKVFLKIFSLGVKETAS
ncbi:MAG: TetR/AcrR family transcriptional regulator [Anaerolineaceae bacterium]|nr:TetR/AcrR family transcriptional regulator [Anaerolineaceae bacterium]